jgi:hypothetical protein
VVEHHDHEREGLMTRWLVPLLLAAAWTAVTVTGASAGIVWGG